MIVLSFLWESTWKSQGPLIVTGFYSHPDIFVLAPTAWLCSAAIVALVPEPKSP